jgi:hypothetical protein
METGSGNPLVDQAAEDIGGKIGRDVPCPCCGGAEWLRPRDLIGMWGQGASVNLDAHIGAEKLSGPIMFWSLILACSNCAFVRWHLVDQP